MKKKGFVYILSNPVFPNNIFKIGKTTRKPSKRAWELYVGSTGVPEPFDVIHQRLVEDCHEAERLLHNRLNEYRINEYREFFKLSLVEAKNKLNQVVYYINKNKEYIDEVVSNKKIMLICTKCQRKNRIPKYALDLSPKCENCKIEL